MPEQKRVGSKVAPEDVAYVDPADEEFIRQQRERAQPCGSCKGGGKVIADLSYLGNVEGRGEVCPDCLGSGFPSYKEAMSEVEAEREKMRERKRELDDLSLVIYRQRDEVSDRESKIYASEREVKEWRDTREAQERSLAKRRSDTSDWEASLNAREAKQAARDSTLTSRESFRETWRHYVVALAASFVGSAFGAGICYFLMH